MKSFTIILLTLIIFSCTITKRRVLPGYHVNWGKSELSINKEDLKSVKYDSDFSDLKNKNEIEKISISPSTSVCDTIFLLDGSSILGKIISLDSKIIEYKSCQDESSFIHKIYKTTIKSISYSNGVVYKHESETEIKEKRKQLEEKHTETIKSTKTNGPTNDEQKEYKYIKRSYAASFILILSLLASLFFLYFGSFLILISLVIAIIALLILLIAASQTSKFEKESTKNRIVEKNGQISIFLFFVAILCLLILIFLNINLTLPLFIFLLIALFTSNIASLFLAIKSLKIMSKNPELYKSKGLILFFTFLESLILLIFSFAAIYVLSGYLNFGV
ncbi:MAG: hypothetical protein LW701_10360 [Fluviicola sp.]|jgi:hypothetical protein|nr:hypothetical protein [Fluviicola sp.]